MSTRSNRGIPVNEEQPYSVVEVRMEIRILHDEITRTRLAVNIYPDESLEKLATASLKDGQYGRNDADAFVVNLSENFSGWADLNGDYPRFDAARTSTAQKEDIERMNRYVSESVNWVLERHKKVLRMHSQ
jgi:hypothetical protein